MKKYSKSYLNCKICGAALDLITKELEYAYHDECYQEKYGVNEWMN